MDISVIDTKKIEEYEAQAKATWGTTNEYQEYEQKAKGRSAEESSSLHEQLMQIFVEIGEAKNEDPAAEHAQALIRKFQSFITEYFYTCSDQILAGLGQMYAAGGEMTENIDRAGGEGTAVFTNQAIQAFCGKQ